jgi:prepilin peptidase CpaA
MFSYAVLIPLFIIACITDIRGQKIPNWLTFPAALAGIIYCTAVSGMQGLVNSAAGLGLGLALLLPFYAFGGMGAGDVKLMGAIGALIGPKAVFSAFLCTALVGGVYAITLLAVYGYVGQTFSRYGIMLKTLCSTGNFAYIQPTEKEKRPLLCYGVAIALGTFLSLICRDMHLWKLW